MRSRKFRYSVAATLLAAVGSAAVIGYGASTSFGSESRASSAGPITLGMIDTMSGPVAGVGQDGLKGANVAVKEINKAGGLLGGRKLKIVVKDEQLSPTASVQDIRQLNSAGDNLVFGFTSSSDALAAMPVAKQFGMAVIAAHASASQLRTGPWLGNFAAIAVSDYLSANAAPTFLKRDFPKVTTWNVFAYDYLTGHQGWDNFVNSMKDAEPTFQTNAQIFIPQNATDYTPYVTKALNGLPSSSSRNQGAYVFLFGSGEVDLFKQGAPYNLSKKYKVILTEGGGYEALANTLKTDTPNSWVGYDYSYLGFHNKTNSQFVKDFEAANHGTPPDTWAEQSYESVLAYAAAIKKAGSSDPSKVMAEFGGLSFQGPQGTVTLNRTTHQAFLPETFTHFVPDPALKQGWKEENAVVIWPTASEAKP